MLTVLISTLVSSTNNYFKEVKFYELSCLEKEKELVPVVREATLKKIKIDQLVVGDLVKISTGMEIVGDGILVSGDFVSVDESSITGETTPIAKDCIARCLIKREKMWQK